GSFGLSAGCTVCEEATSSSVWPSGAARATASVPTCPAAAGRLSTMTVWPSAFSRCGASRRPITSFEPPAGNGTIHRVGWGGQAGADVGAVWAATGQAADSDQAAAETTHAPHPTTAFQDIENPPPARHLGAP